MIKLIGLLALMLSTPSSALTLGDLKGNKVTISNNSNNDIVVEARSNIGIAKFTHKTLPGKVQLTFNDQALHNAFYLQVAVREIDKDQQAVSEKVVRKYAITPAAKPKPSTTPKPKPQPEAATKPKPITKQKSVAKQKPIKQPPERQLATLPAKPTIETDRSQSKTAACQGAMHINKGLLLSAAVKKHLAGCGLISFWNVERRGELLDYVLDESVTLGLPDGLDSLIGMLNDWYQIDATKQNNRIYFTLKR